MCLNFNFLKQISEPLYYLDEKKLSFENFIHLQNNYNYTFILPPVIIKLNHFFPLS